MMNIKNKESLYDWCINNNKKDIVDRWDYTLNKKSPKEIGVNSHNKFWFKCQNNINHTSELHSISGLSDGRTCVSCRQCNSFGQWCLDNDRNDILSRWDYSMNTHNPFQISKSSGIKCYFKCPKGIHASEAKTLYSLTNGKINDFVCNACNSFAQWGIENIEKDFLSKYWDYEKNTIDPYKISYAYNGKVWIKCQKHDYHKSYQISCGKFSTEGKRCPYCAKTSGKIHKYDSLGYLNAKVFDIWSDKNKKSPYEYSPHSGQKIWWKCENKIHDDYLRTIDGATKADFMCPYCVSESESSKLQCKVNDYIQNKYSFDVLHEHECTINPINPKTGHVLPYDNEIKDLKLIIEVMGEQHYKPTQYNKLIAKRNGTTAEKALNELQWRDEFKKQHALSLGYYYLDIPYTLEYNDMYKVTIDETIKQILKINQ